MRPATVPPFPHPAADRGGPIEWAETRRILLVRPDNLGDVVMLTPALRALRAHVPDARLDLLASPVGSSLAPVIPYLDGTLAISPVWQDADGRMPHDPDRELALVSRVKAGRYDVVVVFTSFSQSPWPMAYVAYLAGIPVRAGHSKEFGGQPAHSLGDAPAGRDAPGGPVPAPAGGARRAPGRYPPGAARPGRRARPGRGSARPRRDRARPAV
ncbi:glycosyltransferase family 9 protein, partial [Carbonactinospora thermoautotrophica]|uniref:glycosyltransferase family 9 protein n=1 Tax=Carbonactinospora thermoautotrophica TaxID=1469144 RepID=UPI000AA84DCC